MPQKAKLSRWSFLKTPTDFTQQKNIQGLPITERVNYDFVKATTLTDFFAFFWTTFLIFSFLGFSTLIFSSFSYLHKYFGHWSPLIAFLAILYIFVALLTSLFYTPQQVLHFSNPWHKILPLLYQWLKDLAYSIFNYKCKYILMLISHNKIKYSLSR